MRTVVMCFRRAPGPNLTPAGALLRLDAGLADHLAPLRVLGTHEGRELRRRYGRRDFRADGGHSLDHLLLAYTLHQDVVHARDPLWREARRAAEAEPGRGADARKAGLADRWHFGQQRRATRRQHGDGLQLPCLDVGVSLRERALEAERQRPREQVLRQLRRPFVGYVYQLDTSRTLQH